MIVKQQLCVGLHIYYFLYIYDSALSVLWWCIFWYIFWLGTIFCFRFAGRFLELDGGRETNEQILLIELVNSFDAHVLQEILVFSHV